MMPTQQCLEAAGFVTPDVVEGLVVELEFTVGKRGAQIPLQVTPGMHEFVQLRLEEAE